MSLYKNNKIKTGAYPLTGFLKSTHGTLRHDFADEAANDLLPVHEQLLTCMEMECESITGMFREHIGDLLKQMNLETAYTAQSRRQTGQAMPDESLFVMNTSIGVWLSFEIDSWNAVIDSYISDLKCQDPDKFDKIYESLGEDAYLHYLEHGQHEDEAMVRMAFEHHYKDDMKPLSMAANIIQAHLPDTTVHSHIGHIKDETGMEYIRPVVTITAPDGIDLRDIMRDFLQRKNVMRVVKPDQPRMQ